MELQHFISIKAKSENMIQHRIATTIKKIETVNDSIEYFLKMKLEVEESLTNLINTYMQQCTSEDNNEGVQSLIRYLYWYTDFKVKMISDVTEIDNRRICDLAGDLIFSATCSRCQSVFANKRTSRTDQGKNICPTCENADMLENHKIFLEDWIDSNWATHKNPRMDKATYSAYLHSSHWKKTRSLALQHAGYKCQACSTKEDILDVHHNSYDRLGHEDPSDLIVLCRKCHAKVHNK